MSEPLLSVRNLAKTFQVADRSSFWPGSRALQAVAGVSLDVAEGETVGIVGESGCGK